MQRIISLGAGVQSSTVLLMALHGEFEVMPDCAIFADTGWEPRWVYEHLTWLESVAALASFPIHRVGLARSIKDSAYESKGGKRFAAMPLHVINKDGTGGALRRQCTREFKIEPLTKKQRELVGISYKQRAPKGVILLESWQGISLDEAGRMRDSRDHYVRNHYPLIERRMTRSDCIAWLESHGFPVPKKSACIGCPYHDDKYWRDLRDTAPDEFNDAVEFDDAIRIGLKGVDRPAFLHRSLKPLKDVDLSTAEERGQGNLFMNECEGLCGV